MTVFLLIVALAVILVGCELFVNGIEWFGRKFNLGEGAVGSVLAAVGTALPETIVPLIAILVQRGEAGHEIGIGAILGAPFMLGTLAIFVCGMSVVIYTLTKRRTLAVRYNKDVMRRDLSFFLVAYAIALLIGIVNVGPFRYGVAGGLVIAYAFYVYRTMKAEGDLQGESRSLYFHYAAESPDLHRVILQVIVALAAIIFGAQLFVRELTSIAESLRVPALVISLLITPIATELPEKFNSVSWMRQKKDTLALGNITGAMVFQSTFPVAIGLIFTTWRLDAGENWHAILAAAFALASGLLLYLRLRFGKGFGVVSLLFGGVLYAVFLGVTLATI
jgi:cation:H+ antiporter